MRSGVRRQALRGPLTNGVIPLVGLSLLQEMTPPDDEGEDQFTESIRERLIMKRKSQLYCLGLT